MTNMPYPAKWIKIENNVTALLVPNVEFAGLLRKEERPDWRMSGDLDANWWAATEVTGKMREAKGKRAGYLLLRHNGETEAGLKGFISAPRFDSPHASADFVVTDPDEIRAVIRGERPNISMEFDYRRQFVWGVAMILGEEGQWSEEIPEFRVEGVTLDDPEAKSLGAPNFSQADVADYQMLCAAAKSQKESKMPDSPETIAKIERLEKLALENAKRAEVAEKAAFESKKAAFLSKLTAEKRLVKESDKLELELADTPEKFEAAEKRMAALPVVPERKSFITAPPAKPATDGTESPADEAKKYLAAKKAAGMTRYAASKQLRDEKPEVYKEWLNEINGRDVFQNGRPAPVRN